MVEEKQVGRKYNSQTKVPASILNCRANTENESQSVSMDVISSNLNVSDYFRSSAIKAAICLITEKITVNLAMHSKELGALRPHSNCRWKKDSHPYKAQPKRVRYVFQEPLKRRAERFQKQ